jgi:predicted acylesterase/phospholipase RssA
VAEAAAPAQPKLESCDLVMKGGITSGVVYPAAMLGLSRRYRFRSVGGASAGAIAAVVGAACEYRRRNGDAQSFTRLKEINEALGTPGFLQGLFQPTPGARPAFDILLAYLAGGGAVGRAIGALRATLRGAPGIRAGTVVAFLVWAAFVVFTAWALVADGFSWVDVVAVVLLAVVSVVVLVAALALAVALALGRTVAGLNRALEDNGLGICSGAPQPGLESHKALTYWLHEQIQLCAGLEPDGEPLSFAMLERGGADDDEAIFLRLVTTDLSYSRPVGLPLPDDPEAVAATTYLFDPDEMRRLFPKTVVDAMVKAAGTDPVALGPGHDRKVLPMPGSKLPIVVAARLSLSFPILLTTVPLWSRHEGVEGGVVRHAMSDGGISSNFPIHFFDALLPGRPTFGLDLQPYPDPEGEPGLTKTPPIVFGDKPRLPSFTTVGNVFTFVRQILNAALNWRDSVQAEMPGFRDRVCEIRLTRDEGGLNLNMPPEVIQAIERKGELAARAILDGFDWNRHRFVRYLTFGQAVQKDLDAAKQPFAALSREVPVLSPDWEPYYEGHQPPWWDEARAATGKLLYDVTGTPDLEAHAPQPPGDLRIRPSV